MRITSRRTAFTLVELLVVIGIIALLISILLPSLTAAREQANSVKCLSNLRQLGVAAAAYTSQNRGYLIPADVSDKKFPASLPYQDVNETWATILVAEGLLTYPDVASTTVPPGDDTVFRCPSGVLENTAVTYNSTTVPDSRKDGRGAMAVVHTSTRLMPNKNIFAWYGINATNNTGYRTPFFRTTIETDGRVTGTRKSNEVRNASEMVFLFDGLYGLNYLTTNANRINARHNNQKITNIAFVDGHAESIPTKSLPGGDGAASTSEFLMANIVKYPHPKWRLEQK